MKPASLEITANAAKNFSIPLCYLFKCRYPKQIGLMIYLELNGGSAEISQVKSDLRADTAAMTNSVQVLRRDGIIIRTNSQQLSKLNIPDDRRGRYQLTEKGSKLATEAIQEIEWLST